MFLRMLMRMESTKTSRGFLIAILLLVVAGLTALDIYQDHVINKQRYELRWLMTHSIIRPDAAAVDPAKAAPAATQGAAKNDPAKVSAADVAVVPQSTKPAAGPRAAKP